MANENQFGFENGSKKIDSLKFNCINMLNFGVD